MISNLREPPNAATCSVGLHPADAGLVVPTAKTGPPARPAAESTSRPKDPASTATAASGPRYTPRSPPAPAAYRTGPHQLAAARAETTDRTGPGTLAHGPDGPPVRRCVFRQITATFAPNSDAEPDQPTRPASVAAGILRVFNNNSRTLGANASKTRHSRRTLILRRPIHGSAGNPHDPADLTLRVLTVRKHVAYLSPIIQIDHLP